MHFGIVRLSVESVEKGVASMIMASNLKAVVVTAFSALSALGLCADITYVHDSELRTLTVTVDSGDAQFDDDDSLALLTGNVVTNFVKSGAGRLDLAFGMDISAYLGTLTIDGGTYRISSANNVGDSTTGNGGVVRIKDGGALELRPLGTSAGGCDTIDFPQKTFCLSGAGPDGMGCVIYNPQSGKDQSGASLGNCVVLEDDALISVTNRQYIYWNNRNFPMTINRNGHDLRIRAYADRDIIFGYPRVTGGGRILVERGQFNVMNCYTSDFWVGDDSNSSYVVITNGAGFVIGQTHTEAMRCGLIFEPQSSYIRVSPKNLMAGQVNTNCNVILGQVQLNAEKVEVQFTKGDAEASALSFRGPIHGGSRVSVRNIQQNRLWDAKLHLFNPENDFTGPWSIDGAQLYLWADGALPANCGGLFATNASLICAKDSVFWHLPQTEFSGTGYVSRAYGRWNGRVLKTGAGELVYDSFVDGDELEIRSGTVRMRTASSRGRYAGLAEGIRYFTNTGRIDVAGVSCDGALRAARRAFEVDMINTNTLSLGMMAMYAVPYADANGMEYWVYDVLKEGSTLTGKYGDAASYITYSGWIWNNSPTNETWTFVGTAGTYCGLKINGESVFEMLGWDGMNLGVGVATLTPGANRILCKVYSSTGGSAPHRPIDYTSSNVASWADRMGIGFCRHHSADKPDVSDFSKLVDPGDGSLLTYRRPEDDECPVPGSDVILEAGCGGIFDRIVSADGATLDLDGGTYEVKNYIGFGKIVNCQSFEIKSAWTVDVGDVMSGGQLSAPKLVFGDNAVIRVVNNGNSKSKVGRYVIFSGGDVVGVPKLTVEDEKNWRLELADEKITLIREHTGLVVICR